MSIIIKKNEFSRRIKILQDSKESSSRVFDVRSLETMSNPVSGIRFNAAALDALHFQMQIHRCGGHQRGQVYSSDDILVACERVIKSNLSFVFSFFETYPSFAFRNNDHRSSFELKTREWKCKGYFVIRRNRLGMKRMRWLLENEKKIIYLKKWRVINSFLFFKYSESTVHFNCSIPRRFFDIYIIIYEGGNEKSISTMLVELITANNHRDWKLPRSMNCIYSLNRVKCKIKSRFSITSLWRVNPRKLRQLTFSARREEWMDFSGINYSRRCKGKV